MPTSNRSSSIRQPPSTLRRSFWEPRLPAPRRPTRSTRAGYLVNSSQMILTTTGSSPISTLRPRTRAGLNTLPTSRSSHRPIRAQRSGLMVHAVPNRGGNAFNTSALLQGATYVQSGWQGDLLAQCSPSPAIPYPCFDLNSGPYGSLNTTTGAFTPPQVPDVAGAGGPQEFGEFCRTGAGGSQSRTERNPLPARCTVTCAPVPMAAAWQSEVRLQARRSWSFRVRHFPLTSRQAWTRTRLSSGPYRPRPSKA